MHILAVVIHMLAVINPFDLDHPILGRMETDETENGNGKAEIWKWSSEIQ